MTGGTAYGMDFNPTVDRVRVVNNNDTNLRINPFNGTVAGTDTPLNPAGGDVAAVAYDRINIPQPPVVAGEHDAVRDQCHDGRVRHDRWRQLDAVAQRRRDPQQQAARSHAGRNLGHDDRPRHLVPRARLRDADPELDTDPLGLYTINPATGAATLIGSLAAPLGGFAIVPGASVIFDPASLAVDESAGSATVTVTRVGTPGTTTTVDYATSDGTATSADYLPVHGTLTFGPDDVTKSFTVPIVNDSADELDETVTLALSSPTAAVDARFAVDRRRSRSPTTTLAPQPVLPPDQDRRRRSRSARSRRTMYSDDVRSKGIKVSITPSEPAKIAATLFGTVTTSEATCVLQPDPGHQEPQPRLRQALGHAQAEQDAVRSSEEHRSSCACRSPGSDAAGNVGSATKTITVKPKPKPKKKSKSKSKH